MRRISCAIIAVAAAIPAVPDFAVAQTPACNASYRRAMSAPRSFQAAQLRAFVANCPRHPSVGAARRRIAELSRPPAPEPRPQPRQDPRPERPDPPRRPQPPIRTVPPAPTPPPVTRPGRDVAIENACPYPLQVRLIWRTGRGWEHPADGGFWNVAANSSITAYTGGVAIRAISDEAYYLLSNTSGTPYPPTTPYDATYGGVSIQMSRTNLPVDANGAYRLRITC